MSFRCFSGESSRPEREKWANLLMCLGGKLNILQFLLLFSVSPPPPPLVYPIRLRSVWARLVGLTLGSASQMLPRSKQKHLSPAQPWLSPSDKSRGGLCQRCPACHLSPSYTISPLRSPTHTYTRLPICTRSPSSWQCDRSRWFTPFLPSGLLCSHPRLAHLWREWEEVVASSQCQWRDPCSIFFFSGCSKDEWNAYRSLSLQSGISSRHLINILWIFKQYEGSGDSEDAA